MEIIWTEKIDAILNKGIFLNELGIRNWALTKSDALIAIEEFNAAKISILGGDVFENKNGSIAMNYDHWSCDTTPTESADNFLKRSISKAKNYIVNYPLIPSNEIILFCFVPKT